MESVLALNDSPVDGVFGDDLVLMVTTALNDTGLIPLVPYVITEVAAGNMNAIDEIAAEENGATRKRLQDGVDRSDSEGMYNSVICHDEYVFGDYGSAESRLVDEAPEALEAALLQPVADLFRVCSFWNAGAAAAVENEPVYSDIPTLILAGQYDHATPPQWAWLTAETLSTAYVFEFPGTGHSVLSGVECAIDITTAFLDNPGQEPNSDCIDQIEWPYFE